MNNSLRKLAAGACALVMGASGMAMGAFAADAHTYESLGVDQTAKEKFEETTAASLELPVINITTKDNSELILSKEVYTDCVVDLFNVDEEYELDEVSAGIRVRGNSSAYYGDVNKIKRNTVPYRIKFDKKQNMMGLNDGAKCKSWVLLKSDWDLIRNDVALRMGRALFGDVAYVSDSTFVQLYVNDKYQGTYLLCEQNQVNENRVDITEPEEDYTGTDIGWYLELNNYATRLNADGSRYDTDPYVTMDYEAATVTDIRGTKRQFVPAEYSIKNDVYTDEQVEFIGKYLNNVFEILYKAVEKGEYLTFDENYDLVKSEYTNAEDTVAAVMDLDSAVDMYLLYEIVHDYDCGEGSFYVAVDMAEDSKVPKLQFTSPWDFNWAYNDGTNRYWAGAFCDQWFANMNGDRSNPWFIELAKEPWFRARCIKEWGSDNSAVKDAIKAEKDYLNTYTSDLNKQGENGVEDAFKLLQWIDARIIWMDKTFVEGAEDPTESKAEESKPEESKPEESVAESSEAESQADSTEESKTESKPDSKATSSAAKSNNTTTNPNTGFAAGSLFVAAMAGAVIVINRKRK